MLDLRVDDFSAHLNRSADHAWMAVCDPERLFALRQLCKLLDADVGTALELVKEEPSLLDTPASSLEARLAGIQCLLQLPRVSLLQLLNAAPSLLLAGPGAIEAHVQRVAGGLGLSTTAAAGRGGPESLSRLLQVLLQLGTDVLLDHNAAVQKVSPVMSALSLSPEDALILLHAEVCAGRDLQALLEPSNLDSLARQWQSLSEEAQVPLRELLAALATQVQAPDCRYWLGSCDLLQADSTALQASSHLAASAACRMLLAAPRLARVPSCFFRVLMQYTLFLVPQWRQQLQQAPPAEAATLLAALFDPSGADMEDDVVVAQIDTLFNTADIDYNQELSVLEALLDQGMTAPQFAAPGCIRAGRVWRLVYMCNPRMAAAQQAHQGDNGSTDNSWVGSWSQLFNLQLPGPLLSQMQQQGALSCDLSDAPGGDGPHQRSTAGAAAEAVESLREAVTADVSEFCGRHPNFVHWLHNTAFELEWSHSKASAPVTTWDP